MIEHNKDDTPFPGTHAYYVSTKISGGNSNLCSGTRDFIVQNVSGLTYSWTYSSTLSATGPTNTNQLTVQRNGSSNGAAWVEVSITSPCSGSAVVNRVDFTVGAPVITGYYTISSNYHQPFQQTLYNNNSPIWLPANQSFGVNAYVTVSDAQSVSWTRAGSSYPFSWGSNGATLYFSGSAGSTAYNQRNGIFDATVTNACGTTVGTYTWPVIVQGWGFRMATSPNPASDVITLTITEESSEVKALSKDEDVDIELYAFNGGNLVKKWKFKNDQKQFKLNISNVQRGQYVLVVKKAEFKQTTQIIIEK
ncbi:T9SS type A sorting domain-containing protein [Flavisolibacter sp. BT320]|nr:T9SS type A sorting domain-containing protein [Flavisolibacter longurius]